MYTIRINNETYQSVHDAENNCSNCKFVNDYQMCKEANDLVDCASMSIAWTSLSNDDTETKKDSIVEEVRELLLQRSQTGIKKYGTTLDRTDLKPSEWCQHLLEELLDASGYVLRLKKDIEAIENLTKGR